MDPPEQNANTQVSTLTISPATVTFGSVETGTPATQTITLDNTGNGSVTVSQASVTGSGFTITGLSLPLTLAAGQSASFNAVFSPGAAGSVTGSISVVSNAAGSPATVSLTGTGNASQAASTGGTSQPTGTDGASQASVSPASLNFGTVEVGFRSTATLTMSNTGTSAVTVSQVSATGNGFSVSGPSLPVTLTGGKAAIFEVAFTPATAASSTGGISIVSDASSAPVTIPLSGTGATLLLSLSPANVSFGSVTTGSSSTQTVTLSNTGTAPVTISQATASTGFSISGLSLPITLAAGQSASFNAVFAPAAAGTATGSISVVSNASNSPAAISLSGTGSTQSLSLNPSSLSFGNITIGNNSVLPVVVTNTGTTSVTISQASATPGAGFSLTGPSLPITLAAGQNTTFNVTFTPTATGSATGNLSVVSDASSTPAAASLSATGVNKHSVTLAWVASTSTGITGYNVYSGTVSGGPYTKLNSSLVTSTTYTDSTVQAGQTYYYVTTAVESQSAESADSNQATAVVPSP
ncbi:MAG TPA: choice-of-anchor D domain-containing protein [Terriglobia bacterium]|nr:choice-of-anchor D domain-containing protein [Terriglobia bacterium]